MKYLSQARKKKELLNKVSDSDMNLEIVDFLRKIYSVCNPSKYGEVFPKKIQKDCGDFLKLMNPRLNCGNLHIDLTTFFEVKISFIDRNGNYSLTNIRDWQNFQYFIICFVDGDFSPSFYCIPKSSITDNQRIKLGGMNNNSEINSHNRFVGKRTTINENDINWLFKKENLLKGTTYKHLLNFIKKQK